MENIKKLSNYATAYVLWAVCVLMSIWAAFRVRDAILSWLVLGSLDRYESGARERFYTALQFRATETWSYLVMGLALVVVVVVLEHVFRTGAQAKRVWARFSLMMAVILGVLCLAELAIALAEGAVQPLTGGDFLVPAVYLVPTVLFGWLWRSLRSTRPTA